MKIMGMPLLIEWNKFKPGTSFFVPCIDRQNVEQFVKAEAKRMKFDIVCKHVIEENMYGLRVWRKPSTI